MPTKKPAAKVDDGFKAAVRWFREKIGITKDEWLDLDRRARERSFTVAHVADLDVIQDVMHAVEKALTRGEGIEDFRKRIEDTLTAAWGEERPWHVETIFRNNLQAAYAAGREEQMRDPEILDERPYWMFSAVLDSRTTEICRPLNGIVLPAEDPFWQSHTPPLHHNCRSIKRALTPEQAGAKGISEKTPSVDAQEGFGGADPLEWQPDLSKYDPELVETYRRKTE